MEKPDEKRLRILTIDDEMSIRESFKNFLEDYNYEVLEAENGRIGLEMCLKESPDLVLVDLRMPEVDGLDVLARMGEASPDTPVIVVSGTGVIGDAVEALRLGAWDYLLKPIEDMSVLLYSVEKSLERAHLIKENRLYQERLEAKVASRTEELEKANLGLKQINDRLRWVVDTTRDISVCSRVDLFGAKILEEFGRHMSASGGSLYLAEEEGLRLVHSLDPGHARGFIPFPLRGGAVLEQVMLEGKPLLIKDVREIKGFASSGWEGYEGGSVLAFPLLNEESAIIGLISLHNKKPPPFSEQDREIGAILASYSCEAIRAAKATEELQTSARRLGRLNSAFLKFGTDSSENINRLTALAGETMGASWALYNRLENGNLNPLGKWRLPKEYNTKRNSKGRICMSVINGDEDAPVILQNLQESSYAIDDSNVKINKVMTYMGQGVKCNNITVGAISVLYQSDFIPKEDHKKFLGIIAAAIGVEEERKRAAEEREDLEFRLRQSQKMEAIGTLAGGIAHDFNNILAGVLGFAEIALRDVKEGSRPSTCLKQIIIAEQRAADLVKQILTFSRQTDHQTAPMKIQPVIKEAMKLLRGSLPSTIEIKMEIDPQCPTILADPTRIHQIIMNLATNSYHAMREKGGQLIISLFVKELNENSLMAINGVKPGRYICLTFMDTGQGMDPETQKRIFEPYFTTKKAGEGTGMGLATVHGIVSDYNGHINFKSRPGEGTKFQIFLPCCDLQKDATDHKKSLDVLRGSEKILFVDDEEPLIMISKIALEDLGYRVTTCANSKRALKIFCDDPQMFDIIVTDQTMPNLTGGEMAKKMLELRPDLPIIICTGFSEILNKEQAIEIGIKDYIRKPILINELARAIRRALGESQEKKEDSCIEF